MKPPAFIEVDNDNVHEINERRKREPHILNGSVYPPDTDASGDAATWGDVVAFPWADAITQLGNLVSSENEAACIDSVKRIDIEDHEMLWIRVDVPKDSTPHDQETLLKKCREILFEALRHLEGRVLVTGPNIDIKALSAVDLLAAVARAHNKESGR